MSFFECPPRSGKQSKIYLDLLLALFSFSSFFSFFSFNVWGRHEIIPYYFIFILVIFSCFLWKFNAIDTLKMLPIFFLALLVPFISYEYYEDYFQILIVSFTILVLCYLSDKQKEKIGDYFYYLLYLVVLLMVFQFNYPDSMNWLYTNIFNRDMRAKDLMSYTGGVIGIAPEPSYMGSYLVGVWLYITRFNNDRYQLSTFLVTLGLVLSASLSASLVFLVINLISIRDSKTFHSFLLTVLMFVGFLLIFHSSLIVRFLDFFSTSSEILLNLNAFKHEANVPLVAEANVPLVALDEHFGSKRLGTLYEPFTNFCCGILFGADSYTKGYSIFAKSYYLIAPLHFFLISLAFALSVKAKDRFGLISFLLFFIFGPVLNWMLYSGFIKKDSTVFYKVESK
jgi:hypothetical protein